MTGDTAAGAWTGRVDAVDGVAGRRWHQVVRPTAAGDAPGVALLGFACDAGVARNQGRVGAADGPRALRRALATLAWHGDDRQPLLDAGDVTCEGDALEAAQARYAALVADLLRGGHLPIGLGGGHEIAWAAYQGLAQALDGDGRRAGIAIVNFDAHLDLRLPPAPGRGNSGTPFLQIAESRAAAGLPFRYLCIGASRAANTPALFGRARALGAEWIEDTHASWANWDGLRRHLARFLAEASGVYLTFCLDALPAATAPGVSAPAALGVAPDLAIALLREVLALSGDGAGGRLLLADVAELNPALDVDSRTARVAARIVHEIAAARLAVDEVDGTAARR